MLSKNYYKKYFIYFLTSCTTVNYNNNVKLNTSDATNGPHPERDTAGRYKLIIREFLWLSLGLKTVTTWKITR